MLGLLATSMISGIVVGRTGRYKAFPIAGTAVMALGLYLMSTLDTGTGIWLESLYMLVLGLGIGLAMQVLTIVVQNTVPYAQLGTATSGVTFFRTLGSSFGTAVFGTLYANQLEPNLRDALAQSPGVPPQAAQSPSALAALPAQLAAPIVEAYADTIGFVFRWVVPVALAGFVIAWFLKQVPLRDTARAGATDLGEGFGAPESDDRVAQLERAIAAVMRHAQREPDFADQIFANAGTALTRGQAWTLHQVFMRERAEVPPLSGRSPARTTCRPRCWSRRSTACSPPASPPATATRCTSRRTVAPSSACRARRGGAGSTPSSTTGRSPTPPTGPPRPGTGQHRPPPRGGRTRTRPRVGADSRPRPRPKFRHGDKDRNDQHTR